MHAFLLGTEKRDKTKTVPTEGTSGTKKLSPLSPCYPMGIFPIGNNGTRKTVPDHPITLYYWNIDMHRKCGTSSNAKP
jgi:hypothetical protein